MTYEKKAADKQFKRGRFSANEKRFVQEHCNDKSDAWISRELNRDEPTIRAFRLGLTKKEQVVEKITSRTDLTDDDVLRHLLYAREDWPILQRQYSQLELRQFEYHWINLNKQMPDMTHTELMQVINLIHLNMVMNQSLEKKKADIDQIDTYKKLLKKEMALPLKDQNPKLIAQLDGSIDALGSAVQYATKEFTDILAKYKQMLESLKATRDQRYTQVESSQFSFAQWIKTHNEEKIRKAEATDMELMKAAMNAEFKRLGEYHEYGDGMLDRPILNEETVVEESDDA